MLAARIVEPFYEPEDLPGGLTARQEVLVMNQLRLQRREERLDDSVVPAVALAAHAAADPAISELPPVIAARVLPATIGMVKQILPRASAIQSHG